MKKILPFLVTLMISISTFAFLTAEDVIEKILQLYKGQVVYGIRTVTESGLRNKYRYEEVYRKGFEKLIKVKFPEAFVWFKTDKGCFIWNNDVVVKSSVPINDLEDLLISVLNSREYEIMDFDISGNSEELYELKINYRDQIFDFMVNVNKWHIIKIERIIPNVRTILIYDEIQDIDKEVFDFQMDKYTGGLEMKLAQPKGNFSEQYVQKAISLFQAFMINRLTIKDMKVTFITGETSEKHKLVVIIIEHSKELKSSLKDITNIPKDFNIVSSKDGNLEIFVMGQESSDILQKMLDSLISTPNPTPTTAK